MATDPTDPPADKPSAWSRLPDPEPRDAADAPHATAGARASAAVRARAEDVAARLGDGIRTASTAFAAPASSELEGLLAGTDLPELSGDDALSALALRLDRESDFWRALALRALSRAAWSDRIATIAAVLALVGAASLAVVAALGALVGAGNAGARALLILLAAAVLFSGAGLVAWVCAAIRNGQRATARDAVARADLAELRLHRAGVVLALRATDPELYRDAIARLERAVAAPPR